VVSHFLGEPEAAGVKLLLSVQLDIEHFLWKRTWFPLGDNHTGWKSDCIFILNQIIQIQGLLSIHQVRWMPPPPMGLPRGGSVTKKFKNPLPAVPRRGPEVGGPS